MGMQIVAKCHDCGEKFTADDGGGFIFHLVRCDKCGKTRSISHDELGELHVRYVKGLHIPFSIATSKADKKIQKHPTIDVISEAEYNKGIEAFAGKCGCRGKFKLNAPIRCSKCHSKRIKKGDTILLYD